MTDVSRVRDYVESCRRDLERIKAELEHLRAKIHANMDEVQKVLRTSNDPAEQRVLDALGHADAKVKNAIEDLDIAIQKCDSYERDL